MQSATVVRVGFALVWQLASVRPSSAQATPNLDTMALIAAIDSAPRAQVRLSSGWASLEGPRLVHDTLKFSNGTTLDRGGRQVALASPLSLSAVEEIKVPGGRNAAGGAAVGAGIGGGIGLLAAGVNASQQSCLGCPTHAQGFIAIPILGGLGALVGAAVGTRGWVTVYRTR